MKLWVELGAMAVVLVLALARLIVLRRRVSSHTYSGRTDDHTR